MLSRRPGIIFLAIALVLILLLNGAWFYGYPSTDVKGQPSSLHTGTDKPPVSDKKPTDDVNLNQPELPPQVEPDKEELLFDDGAKDAEKEEKEPDQRGATTTTTTTATSVAAGSSTPTPGLEGNTNVDWSRFAYVQYVTATEHVCNSIMVFEALHRLGSKADRVLLYPLEWGPVDSLKWKSLDKAAASIMLKAKDTYHVILKPVNLIRQKGQERTWEAGFTKLLAFNQTDYARTIMFDNDATVLKHLDHLFLLPPTPLALPRAYWLAPDPLPEKTINKYILSAQLLVVEPNKVVFDAMLDAVSKKGKNDYDMEIINWVLGPVAMVLPHRALNLLSGEFRREHTPGAGGVYDRYLGFTEKEWNAKEVLEETYYMHFSDWPRPKPWYSPYEDQMAELTPKCYTIHRHEDEGAAPVVECSDKETWLWLYKDFAERRKNVCGLDLMVPPERD